MGSILIFAPSISGTFGGLLAAGLLTVSSIGMVHSWRKIFLVDGILTSGFSLVAFFMMPTGPESAWFFTREESADQLGMGSRSHSKLSIKVSSIWLSAIGFCLITIPVVSTSLFLPTIIQELAGRANSVQSNLHSVPQYMVACVFGPLVAHASYTTRDTASSSSAQRSVSSDRYIIFLCSHHRHVRYGPTFLTHLGANAICGIYLGWATANAAPETVRAIAPSVAHSIGPMGPLVL